LLKVLCYATLRSVLRNWAFVAETFPLPSMADAMPVLFTLMAAFEAALITIVVEIVFQKATLLHSFSMHPVVMTDTESCYG